MKIIWKNGRYVSEIIRSTDLHDWKGTEDNHTDGTRTIFPNEDDRRLLFNLRFSENHVLMLAFSK